MQAVLIQAMVATGCPSVKAKSGASSSSSGAKAALENKDGEVKEEEAASQPEAHD